MYIEKIAITNVRTFKKTEVELIHPDKRFSEKLPKPALANVNLLLGNNGAGKTTLLKAVAIAGLGPVVGDARLPTYRLARRERTAAATKAPVSSPLSSGSIVADFLAHPQDGALNNQPLISRVNITAKSDEVERLEWAGGDETPWGPVFGSQTDAFFMVGYGATRRVETREQLDPGARQQMSLVRAQRVWGLFEERFSLIPLTVWLPALKTTNPGRFTQVKNLINELLSATGYRFPGTQELGEYLFSSRGMSIPFPALSDGYRAYLGWIGDLLYHVVQTCPSGKKLVENRGIVMVDEVDLHLHPRWQMTVLPALSKALPNLQFVVTSHSPLVVGSLEWMNIIHMTAGPQNTSRAERLESPIHGLDADQILLTDFFGLESTRAPSKQRRLKQLTLQAREGDTKAARELLKAMSGGSEAES